MTKNAKMTAKNHVDNTMRPELKKNDSPSSVRDMRAELTEADLLNHKPSEGCLLEDTDDFTDTHNVSSSSAEQSAFESPKKSPKTVSRSSVAAIAQYFPKSPFRKKESVDMSAFPGKGDPKTPPSTTKQTILRRKSSSSGNPERPRSTSRSRQKSPKKVVDAEASPATPNKASRRPSLFRSRSSDENGDQGEVGSPATPNKASRRPSLFRSRSSDENGDRGEADSPATPNKASRRPSLFRSRSSDDHPHGSPSSDAKTGIGSIAQFFPKSPFRKKEKLSLSAKEEPTPSPPAQKATLPRNAREELRKFLDGDVTEEKVTRTPSKSNNVRGSVPSDMPRNMREELKNFLLHGEETEDPAPTLTRRPSLRRSLSSGESSITQSNTSRRGSLRRSLSSDESDLIPPNTTRRGSFRQQLRRATSTSSLLAEKEVPDEGPKKMRMTKKEMVNALKAYSLYVKFGKPSREDFKLQLQENESDVVTEDDIESLPWMMNGTLVNVSKMEKIIAAAQKVRGS